MGLVGVGVELVEGLEVSLLSLLWLDAIIVLVVVVGVVERGRCGALRLVSRDDGVVLPVEEFVLPLVLSIM